MLPETEKNLTLEIPHFPTKFQALIFRLWESVPAKRLAETLKTDENTIVMLARDMGLPKQSNLNDWLERGYISILRHAWNILPYSQLCTLLGWDEERLDYILKEDDFLGIKLCGWDLKKTDCEELFCRPLTECEKQRTAEIKEIVEKEITPLLCSGAEAPFDFFNKRYSPVVKQSKLRVNVDGSWCISVCQGGVYDFIDEFKKEVKDSYNIEFCEKSEKAIKIVMNLSSDDEEYHEITIDDSLITLNAAFPTGIMRGLYYLLNLADGAGAMTFDKKTYKIKTKVKTRIIYSFCGLYGDILDKDSRISFPDELLRRYARLGINGVWIQGILYKTAPYPFDEKKSMGWEARLHNLDEMTRRCAKYGIKVYMYINEPRNMPLEFFKMNPSLKGTVQNPGFACLCSSNHETHKYLRSAIQTICTHVPQLGGFINITQSENLTLCYSRGIGGIDKEQQERGITMCPVCGKLNGAEVTADILNTMARAAHEISSNIKFFAYAWSWERHFKGEIENLIGRLDKNIIVLQVSETGIPFVRGGIKNKVIDYSLSIVGPGKSALKLWKAAGSNGLETAAKIQINNSWECSSAPFLPVYDNIVRHMKNLTDAGVKHLMLSWTLGGYVSDNIKIASSFFFEEAGKSDDLYEKQLKLIYGEFSDKVKAAAEYFCRGFGEYPFELMHIYGGPSNAGAANLLYLSPSGMRATMTCYPYDDIDGWCGDVYTPEILRSQYEKLCSFWENGLEIIKDMPLCEFKDMAYYGYTLFKASLNQISFYILRSKGKDKEKMLEIVKSEKELALLACSIMLRNSAVGYEAANHYYVTRCSLFEKIINCEWIKKELTKN